MKYRIFKYICVLIITSFISFNIVISISNIKADPDSTSETIKYEGYWKEVSEKYEKEEESWNALHQLTRLPSKSNDTPSITVLVHGYGGKASNWSNDSNWNFAYDSTSLIERLRTFASGANVYLATYPHEDSILMQRCDVVDNQYVITNLNKIDDVSKHTIIVFESFSEKDHHRNVYKELHCIIDLVSYDILYLTGRIPKVNFISHSRGGLISMMYASGYRENGKINNVEYTIEKNNNYIDVGDGLYEIPCEYDQNSKIINDHPYNVDTLFSLGTPYNGTKWDTLFNGVAHDVLKKTFNYSGAKNILDEVIQNEIKGCWEEAVQKNNSLNLHAISGTFNLSFIIGLLSEDCINIDNSVPIPKEEIKLCLNLIEYFGVIADEILFALENNLRLTSINCITIPSIFPFLTINLVVPLNLTADAVGVVRLLLDTAIISLNNFRIIFYEILNGNEYSTQSFFTELAYVLQNYFTLYTEFENLLTLTDNIIDEITNKEDYINCSENLNLLSFFGDLFIDKNSQSAKGFSNVTEYEKLYKYENIVFGVDTENNCVIDFLDRNFEYKKATNNVGIPHNLETMDEDIINYICDNENIVLGIPSSIYKFEELNDNTLSIIDVDIPNYYSESYESFLYSAMKFKNISLLGSNSFAEASYLTSFIIPDTVIEIEDNAFSDCINLESITLPKHLVEIGDKAFKGCTSLSSVTLLKDCYDVPILGANVFEECASNLQIHVPKNKYIDYCIGPNWEDYEQKIVIDDILDSLSLNCVSYGNLTLELDKGYNKLYKLNIECSKSYKFTTDSNIIFKIYKSNKDVLYIGNQNLSVFLSVGEYYLDIRYNSNNLNGSFEVHYELTYLSSNIDVNIDNITNFTSNLHLSYDNKKHSVLRFDNNQGEGFYKFKLNAGNISLYPSGAIKIYKDQARTILHDRFDTDILSYSAISKINENEIYVYLENNETYYIDILINNIEYSSVNFEIKKVEESNIDYINSFINMGFNSIFENVNKYSYFEKVIIKQKSKVQIDVIASGLLNSCVPIFIFKEEMDLGSSVNNRDYYLETILIGETTPINTMPAFGSILEPGTYYIGYIENQEKAFMNVAITRIVEYDDNMGNVLVADPYHVGYDLGTEVLYNYGECNNYTITEGFTRNIYLMVEDRFTDPMSRLYYDWYSSNESAAIVTNFGTVLAMPVNEDTTVTIYAALKTDPSIVYYRTFTILNDEEEDLIEIECDMSYSYSEENGTYQLELNNTNCPYPMIQYYNWRIVNYTNVNVSINNWGNVSSNGPTEVLIVGTYILNPKVRIYIYLLITE